MQTIKLNLGGNEIWDGGAERSARLDDYIHCDIRDLEPDGRQFFKCDIRNGLSEEWKGTVSEIRCSHCLEHWSYNDGINAVTYWSQFLIDGGLLRLYVPDSFKISLAFSTGIIPIEQFSQCIYGNQEYELNYHVTAYDQDRLNSLVRKAGLFITSMQPRLNMNYPFDVGVQAVKRGDLK